LSVKVPTNFKIAAAMEWSIKYADEVLKDPKLLAEFDRIHNKALKAFDGELNGMVMLTCLRIIDSIMDRALEKKASK